MTKIENLKQFQKNENYEVLSDWAYQVELADYIDTIKLQGKLSTLPYCIYNQYRQLIDNADGDYIYITNIADGYRLVIVKE